jgi:predicted DNA-binding transcriptional regulator YafY
VSSAVTTRHAPGRRKGSYSQASRVLRVLDLLRRAEGPVPLLRIASMLDVSERQVRRDVAVLVEAGHPMRIAIVDGRSAVESLERETTVALSARERQLLASLGALVASVGPGALGAELRAALDKLSNSRDDEDPPTIVAGPAHAASVALAERVDRIERAIRERLELRVRTAADRDERRTHAFLPYVLVLVPGGVHVVGRWDPGEPIRAVPVERLTHVELAPGTSVAAPHAIDLARVFEPGRAVHAPRAAMT